MDKFAITSKSVSCLGCSYNKQGSCHWFANPRTIPHDSLLKGCKYRIPKVKFVMGDRAFKELIETFDGELL